MRHERAAPRQAAGEDRKGEDCGPCAVLYYSADGGSTVGVTLGLQPDFDLPVAEVSAVDCAGRRGVRIHGPPS